MVLRTKSKIPAQATGPRRQRRKPTTKEVRLADLPDHPDQAHYFGSKHDADLPGLIASIRTEGLKQPIEILPAGNNAGLAADTILVGHRRKAALMALGHSVTKAIVRYDLLDADADMIRGLFISDNLVRRQLHALDKARAVLGLVESRLGRKLDPMNNVKVREEIEAALEVSGRHLLRVLRIISLPVPLQHAVRDGHVPMTMAEKLTGLSKTLQMEIGSKISAARPADMKNIVVGYLPAPQPHAKSATKSCEAFLRILQQHLPRIQGREQNIYRKLLHDHLPLLVAANSMIVALQEAAAKYNGVPAEELLAKLASDIQSKEETP